MAKRKILVITDHMPWGHRAIAKAIFNYLKTKEKKNNWEVSYSQVVAETSKVGTLYNFVYQYFPASNKVLHKLSSNKLVYKTVIDFATLNIDNLEVVVKKYKPDLIISAYFFHSHALEEMRRVNGYNYKLWTIAADPWTINPLSFVPGADLNLVYDKAGVKLAVKWGVEKDRVMETGWWTRQEMYQECDRTKMRKKLGVTDDRPVLFVSGGSLGSAAVGKLLPTLMTLNREMMVVFNSGTGKFVFEMVEQYKKMYERVMKGKKMVTIKNLGWIENMNEMLSAADIVLGKAGPNFLFESIAAKRPFVAITHIGGQEDGNIDLIKYKKLGWVREKPSQLSKFMQDYSKRPGYYHRVFEKFIKAEAERNKESLPKIEKRIKEEFGN